MPRQPVVTLTGEAPTTLETFVHRGKAHVLPRARMLLNAADRSSTAALGEASDQAGVYARGHVATQSWSVLRGAWEGEQLHPEGHMVEVVYQQEEYQTEIDPNLVAAGNLGAHV